jgi:hypothetical protein
MAKSDDPLHSNHPAAGKNRRASPRWHPSAVPSLKRAEVVDGPEARLLNISRGGVLIETTARMIPGAKAYLRLVAADAVFLLTGRVLRSRAVLLRDSVLLYQSAIAFDQEFPLVDHETAGSTTEVPSAVVTAAEETAAGKPGCRPPPAEEHGPITYRVSASIPRSGPDLHQIFGLNNW